MTPPQRPHRGARPTYERDERRLLEGWLDFHRETLIVKCDGLGDDQRKARPISSSLLSLHGLVRHLADVERNWFQRILLNRDVVTLWTDPSVQGSPLVPLDDADWERDVAVWRAQCAASREAAADLSLDSAGQWRGKDVTLRSVYCHLIQEYARHNGHADMIRELLDGATGL
jgi:uncharacterized damage-inducible protein DinB